MSSILDKPAVQNLLDQASGLTVHDGDLRLKVILRDLLSGLMAVIERHDVTENEFWGAVDFLHKAGPELGLIIPGLGIEHFLDLRMDAADEAAGLASGTPRTIEGPLYVAGAPLASIGENITQDIDEGPRLTVSGHVRDTSGQAIANATVHVWQANSRGFYSHFDPTGEQSPFNNRRRFLTDKMGRYAFSAIAPKGYSVPPEGATALLMRAIGRHGNRPAHIHFFVEAPGYRALTTQINFADDPHVYDDFAFGTRDGLLVQPERKEGGLDIAFDITLVKARNEAEQRMSTRPRMTA
jgi:catechol 1,2-dioxygenase